MSRSRRLLDLIQALRRRRRPVSGHALADELGISIRTLYRDIATLQEQGAAIDGEPGIGYVLRPGFMLPPLMLSEEEIEALVLGTKWVARQGDARLGAAARNAIAKIGAVLPPALRDELDVPTLLVGSARKAPAGDTELAIVRGAIRGEYKLSISYRDAGGALSRRTIWPVALGFFESVRVVAAWCELRQDFRHFRTDRIHALRLIETHYPRRRRALLSEWREREGIPGEG